MAVLGRLVRTAHTWRTVASPTTLIPSPPRSRGLPRPLYHRPVENQSHSNASEVQPLRLVPDVSGPYSILPAVWASLFGVGVLQVAYADGDQAAANPPFPSQSSPGYADLEETAKKERQRIEELLRSKGMRQGFCPRFTVAIKGKKVEERGGGSDMSLRAWDSAVAWQITLTRPGKQVEVEGDLGHSKDINAQDGDLCILIFRSLISSEKAEIEFIKEGSLSSNELEALVSVLELAGGKLGQNWNFERKPREGTARVPSAEKSVASLEAMGVKVYGLDEAPVYSSNIEISWDNIAGYDQQKREIEDTILLALHSPEVYDDIACETRQKFESNRPRAVLFDGPPGTGKTSCARVIANQAGVPLLYVPLEVVMSKYFGESERLLGKVFSLANELPNGAIIFLDEIDSFAVARDSEMHEATRRILSVLLRQIDGFEQDKKVVVIGATNRKQDLDLALISRFDSMINFGLPDQQNRQEITAQYAKHLSKPELDEVARVTEEMSGRDIRDVCQQAERSWASKIIRGQASKDGEPVSLCPPLQEYIESAITRRKALLSVAEPKKIQNSNPLQKNPKLDLC
ncbi:hypothetical protein ACB098_05G167100 [Castanea mollissima]